MAIEFGDKVRRIPVYPAADGYAFEGPVAMLASNESPYPPIPAVVEAVTKALTGLNRYPDPTNAALRRRLSDIHGVPAQRIAIGNGSCDILLAAGDALLEPGAELVYAWPAFSVYPHLAAASGARAADRDRQRLVRHPARGRRRAARAGRRARLRLAGVQRLSAPGGGVRGPRSGSRSATARATSCSRPATRCSSRAPSSSTPGRRSASIRTWRRRPGRAQRIAIGNGSCDILLAAGDALLEPGAELVYAWPAFSVYPHLAAASGARAIAVPLTDDHRHDLEAMLGE